MKRIAIAAAAALVMVGAAQAQTRAPLYGEIGYSFLEVKDEGFKANPQAIRGIVGYEFHPNVAVEGMLMFGTTEDGETVNDPFLGPVDLDVKVRNAFGLFVKPKMDFGNIEAFGRLGWARTKLRATASVPGASASGSDSDSSLAFGVGANYRFNPRMSVGLDWMRYNKDGSTKVQGWTVNFGYRF
ncbi:MAG TPA: porin family protein [Ramlibacter sp.]|uniref:porin family protein n=1 Tax=Ramlibacter sp. TaxID=1917967 RepID=UPI002D7E2C6D|nr:porin family protein [Ramlibacter sp.]HET8747528.1 porin family protein [Ramlibacter sp.]